MEKQRNSRLIAVFALVISVISLSVGYSALARELSIESASGTVESSTWNVSFASLDEDDLQVLGITNASVLVGSATMNGTPAVGTTSLSGINLSVQTPGDEAYFYAKVVNSGSYNAVSDGITVSTTGTLTEDEQNWVDANASFKVEYLNENTWEEITDTTELAVEKTSGTIYVRVSLKFNGDATTVPDTAITFPTKKVTIPFVVAE